MGILEPFRRGLALENDGDELHAVPLRRGGDAVPGGVGGAGLQAGGAVVKPHQLVGVHQGGGAAPEGVHPDGGVVPDVRMVQHQFPAHEGDIVGGGDVALRRKAAGVFESGVLHAQLRRPLVHPLHEGLLTACQMLRQGHGTVVGGHHAHRLQHFVHRQLFPLLQPDLAAPHGTGVGGGDDGVLIAEGSAVDGLHHQQDGHDLGDAGRLQLGMLVLGVEDGAGFLFHQQRRRRCYLHGPGADAQKQDSAKRGQCFFHGDLPFLIGKLYVAGRNFMQPTFFVLQNGKRSAIIPFVPAAVVHR